MNHKIKFSRTIKARRRKREKDLSGASSHTPAAGRGSRSMAGIGPFKISSTESAPKETRNRVKVGILLRILPGGKHAMYASSLGPIRKPL